MARFNGAGGKKGRSGPPGNLNGVRLPWRTFWRRRALRPEDRWLLPVLERYLDELLDQKGGRDNVTAAESHLAEIAQTARGCSLLILRYAREYGRVRKVTDRGSAGWDLMPGMKELPRFLGIERQALTTFGTTRVEPRAIELRDWLEADPEADDPEPDSQTPPEPPEGDSLVCSDCDARFPDATPTPERCPSCGSSSFAPATRGGSDRDGPGPRSSEGSDAKP